MPDYYSLAIDQMRLYDRVEAGAWDGSDLRDVLDGLEASPEDKAAVAEVLGGPGAGERYVRPDADVLRVTARQDIRNDDNVAEA